MNVILTERCNRRCPFCFAGSRVNTPKGKSESHTSDMPEESVNRIMDFIAATGNKQLRLLGGEPTLHPRFKEIVSRAIDRDFHVHVFSNGMMKKETADFLSSIESDKISLLCNISNQANDSQRKIRMREYALKQLGERAQLGITVSSPDFEYQYVIDQTLEFKLRNRIRVGIAQPIVGQNNDYLDVRDYRAAGKRIMEMVKDCIKNEILVGFDCGITLCMFDESEIGTLMKQSEGFAMRCNPIIDVGPDLTIWSCFPLSDVFNTKLTDFNNRNEIVSFYNDLLKPYRSLGIMAECLRCVHLKRGQCTGGCIAHTLNSLDRLPPKNVSAAGQ